MQSAVVLGGLALVVVSMQLPSREIILAVVGAVIAFVQLAAMVPKQRARVGFDPDDRDARVNRARQQLAVLVAGQWKRERRQRGLVPGHLIRVRWSIIDRPSMDDPASVARGLGIHDVAGVITRLRAAGDVATLVQHFRSVPGRRLVIVGVPGSGKTALCTQLTTDLPEH